MATPRLLPEPKRTCEQSLAFRATVSPPHLRRKLPQPALPPLPGPSPAQVLRELLKKLDGPRAALYTRIANRALDDGDNERIASEIKTVQREIDELQKMRVWRHQTYPLLYPNPAA